MENDMKTMASNIKELEEQINSLKTSD